MVVKLFYILAASTLALPLMYFMIESDDKVVWQIAALVYVVAAGVIPMMHMPFDETYPWGSLRWLLLNALSVYAATFVYLIVAK